MTSGALRNFHRELVQSVILHAIRRNEKISRSEELKGSLPPLFYLTGRRIYQAHVADPNKSPLLSASPQSALRYCHSS